jgi:hypothetical protein
MVDLDALERLHAAATPGPWVARRDNPRKYAPLGIWGEGRRLIAMYGDDGREANLIVAARNALPDLLRELRDHREALRFLVSHFYEHDGSIRVGRQGDSTIDFPKDMPEVEALIRTTRAEMDREDVDAYRAALSRETTGGGE